MTKPTGRPPGRPKGSKSKHTVKRAKVVAKVAAAIERVVPGAFDGDAHAFLMTVYKDPDKPIELRLDAAGKAIRYEKPALATIDVTSMNEHVVHTVSDKPVDRDGAEWLVEHGTAH